MKSTKILFLAAAVTFATSSQAGNNEFYLQHSDNDVSEFGATMSIAGSETGYMYLGADTDGWIGVGVGAEIFNFDILGGNKAVGIYGEAAKDEVLLELNGTWTRQLANGANWRIFGALEYSNYGYGWGGDVDFPEKPIDPEYPIGPEHPIEPDGKPKLPSIDIGVDFGKYETYTYSIGTGINYEGFDISHEYKYFDHQENGVDYEDRNTLTISYTYHSLTPYAKYDWNHGESDDKATVGLAMSF